MDTITRLVVCALAVFRLAELLVIDDGAFEMFINLRGFLNRMNIKVLTCVHCIGVWFAIIFAFTFYFSNPIIDFTLLFMAIAGLQSIIAGNLGRNR